MNHGKAEAGQRGGAVPASKDRFASVIDSDNIKSQNAVQPRDFTAAQMELFEQRCKTLADRVRGGGISFIDAVDMAASAAEWSGLADAAGYDACESVMATAFMGCPKAAA